MKTSIFFLSVAVAENRFYRLSSAAVGLHVDRDCREHRWFQRQSDETSVAGLADPLVVLHAHVSPTVCGGRRYSACVF